MAKKRYTIKAPSKGDFQENGNTADVVREPIPTQGWGTKDDRPFPTEKTNRIQKNVTYRN